MVHDRLKKFECEKCKETFSKRCDLKHHMDTKHESDYGTKIFNCVECNKEYPHERALRLHIHNVHKIKPKHPCDLCGRQYKTKDVLKRHYITEEHKRKIDLLMNKH